MLRRVVLALCALALAGVQTHAQFLPGRPPGLRPGFQFLGLSNANGFPSPGSVADYDWANGRFAGPPVTVSRASGASVAGPDGLIAQAEPNTARVEYEPKAGAPRKNWLRNSTFYGGVAGSPGTTPTNHNIGGGAGLTRTLAFGTLNGIPYMDVTFAGTTSASTNVEISFDGNNAIPAWAGQAWAASSYIQVTKDDPALTVLALQQVYINAAGSGETTVRTQNNVYATRTTWQNYSIANPSIPAGTGTAYIRLSISTNAIPTGTAVNFTIRVGAPQLEQSAMSTAWIPTTTQAAEAGGRVNYIRNSTFQGVTPGVISAAGVLPGTNNIYVGIPAGITTTVLGVEKRGDLDVLRVQLVGTATANQSFVIQFDSSNANILGSQGQAWTSSVYAGVASGTLPGTFNLGISEYGPGATGTSFGTSSGFTPSTVLSRLAYTRTLQSAATVSVSNNLNAAFTVGQVVNAIIEIAAPQLEQGSTATPIIKTFGFPVSADSPRTNWIRYSDASGYTPGDFSLAASRPLGWTASQSLTGASVVTEDPVTLNGVTYMPILISGVSSTNTLRVVMDGAGAAAAAGQVWSVAATLADGTTGPVTGLSSVRIRWIERQGGTLLADSSGPPLTLTTSGARVSRTAAIAQAATNTITPEIVVTVEVGTPINFRLLVAQTQLEQRGAPSDWIRTQGIPLTTDVERRNYVRDTTGAALTVGSSNLPATWSGNGSPTNGITRTLVAKGVNPDGTPYLDYRYQGTSTATGANLIGNIIFDGQAIPAAPGQITVNHSISLAVVAGALPALGTPVALTIEKRATTTAWQSASAAVTSALTRFQVVHTPTDAGLTGVMPSLWLYGPTTAGTAVDFTLRISVPQFEPTPYATPPIVTTGTAVTVGPGSAYSRGLLIEGSQTNYIPNNAMVGATVGGSGGAGIPTGWSGSLNGPGVSSTIVALTQQRGLDCIDMRVSGTATATVASVLFLGQTSAAPGQLYTLSGYTALVSGSFPGGMTLDYAIRESDSSATFLRQTLGSVLSPVTFSRAAVSATTGASTSTVAAGLRLGALTGTVIDFTLRQCSPQLERWDPLVSTVGGASSVIRTTGTAATRAADVVSVSQTNLGSAFTVAALARFSPITAGNPTNHVLLRLEPLGTNGYRILNDVNGFLTAGEAGPNFVGFGATPTGRFAVISAADAAGQAGSLNGGTVATNAAPVANAPTVLRVGGNGDGSAAMFGNVERVVLWPYRAANSNLPAMGSVGNLGN